MNLLHLLSKESTTLRRDILITTSLAGLSSTAVLAIINGASRTASHDSFNARYLVMFIIAVALYVICLRSTFDRTTRRFESVIEEIRIRVSDKIRRTDLQVLNGIGKAEIYNRLIQDTATVSQFKSLLTAAMQSGVIVIFVSLYMAFLSRYAFIITALLLTVGIAIFLQADKVCRRYIERTSQKEIEFFETFTHIIDGFQEIKINQRKSDDLFKDTTNLANIVKDLKIATEQIYNDNYILTQCLIYFTLAGTVFLLPRLVPTSTVVITETTTAILFFIGPLSTVVGVVPHFARANIAVEHIFELERRLDAYQSRVVSSPTPETPPIDAFVRIDLTDVEFTYVDKDENRLFTVGPLSLSLHAGETLFIIGGNGSGKSTFLKLLTALYYPERGTITIDNLRLDRHAAQSYRELFSIIFADFHLFDKLYGLRDVQPGTVLDLLERMGLSTRTNFVDGRFTTLDLSTGQRKRLALLVTLLEDRPIYVFDEWAAEQDPEFRTYFYEVLLHDLHERGKTIIAVTHDDRYFHRADRIMKMDYGKIEFIKTPAEL